MARYAILQSFYAGSTWQTFRLSVILTRGLKCEHCREEIDDMSKVTLHHIKELTPDNVSDPMISLNPMNVMVVHKDCHDQIHGRFGYTNSRGVFLIYGAPLSGKKTYVRQQIGRGDLVVDMDALFTAVSQCPTYDKPNELLINVLGLQAQLIDNVKTRYGKWSSAWIIGGYADKYKREKTADDTGAEIIFCDTSKDECLRRLSMDPERRNMRVEWERYINEWFERYTV